MSKKTKQVKVMVVSRGVMRLSCISRQKTHSVPDTMMDAEMMTLISSFRVMMGSLALRGGCRITS